MTEKKRVVITGMGCVSCFGNDVDVFYDKLLAGESAVSKIDAFPCDEYPTQIAASIPNFDPFPYVDKKQARRVDPYINYSIVAGKKALEHAQLAEADRGDLDLERCGVLVGSGMGGMGTFSTGVEALINKGHKRVSPFFVPYIITNMGGALLAMDLGFMGPNYSISTACATANYCIAAAANHLRNGDADLMLCGGVEAPIIPIGLAGFVACKALSKNNEDPKGASRPWDSNRDGFVMGEGAGVLVLETLEHAQARGATILAEYLGGAFTCDAYHMTSPHEDGLGVALCVKNALADAGVSFEDVNYINAHATSTPVGDMAEVKAVKKVFTKTDHLRMNATKSMIGHSLGAAAAFEAIVTVKAIQTGRLHPSINLKDPEPDLDIDVVANVAQDFDVNIGLSNSFGFGGHNASIVISRMK
ncbi:3-oxoacyl-[acyl-carrier-protein] synthase I, chloroplastic [Chlamydiales bacterium SCGC AG-110-M15]|nr:3-oxoacyl-[acyl-carrier-protein] synthase I, chloroplastic [Chlamydiales bacterium SCGC AG-110-M15]